MSTNKFKQLTKRTAKLSVTALVVVGCFGGLYTGVLLYAGSVETQKAEAEKKLTEDKSNNENLSSQMNQSTVAEKRFTALQATRTSADYTISQGTFTEWLKGAKTKFHLANLLLTPAPEALTDRTDLAQLKYKIMVRPRVKVEFRAVSDLHAFSFLDELASSNAGFTRVDHLDIRRRSDLDEGIFKQLQGGATTILVDVKLEVTNISVLRDDKATTPPAAPGAPGTVPVPGQPSTPPAGN